MRTAEDEHDALVECYREALQNKSYEELAAGIRQEETYNDVFSEDNPAALMSSTFRRRRNMRALDEAAGKTQPTSPQPFFC